ncbi:MAG: class III signal peptide-containing protein [Candidatus Micrarchaeota archaeon]
MKAHVNRLWGTRAQVSLEFLILFMAFLAFISVWLSLILTVGDGIEESVAFSRLDALASDVREAADAVCLMGPGSSRSLTVGTADIGFSERTVTVSSENEKVRKRLRCACVTKQLSFEGETKLVIKNIKGTIEVSVGLDY